MRGGNTLRHGTDGKRTLPSPRSAGETLIVKERNYLIFLCLLTVFPTWAMRPTMSKNPSLSTILQSVLSTSLTRNH